MVFFISDTHFNHRGSLLWNDRTVRPNFESVKEMNDLMINNWNKVVKNEDTVYFLGDFAYKCPKYMAESTFWILNGKKHLIIGNHDYNLAAKFEKCWESMAHRMQYDFTDDNGVKREIIMDHYPLLSWRHSNHGSWHLHGHTHGSIQHLSVGVNRYDCSVEVNNYSPISLDQVCKIFRMKEFERESKNDIKIIDEE